jgi:hypothetical protein
MIAGDWVIGSDTKTATIRFDDGESGVEFVVGIAQLRFPNGGSWSKFVCPCGRRAQKLRLFEGRAACGHCVRAAGMRYRSDMCSHFSKRGLDGAEAARAALRRQICSSLSAAWSNAG